MNYRWSNVHEWLSEKAGSWDAQQLYHEFMALAGHVDFDTLQDIYQPDMEDDGYFEEKAPHPSDMERDDLEPERDGCRCCGANLCIESHLKECENT